MELESDKVPDFWQFLFIKALIVLSDVYLISYFKIFIFFKGANTFVECIFGGKYFTCGILFYD